MSLYIGAEIEPGTTVPKKVLRGWLTIKSKNKILYDPIELDFFETEDPELVSGKTYYEKSGTVYTVTEDQSKQQGKTYYELTYIESFVYKFIGGAYMLADLSVINTADTYFIKHIHYGLDPVRKKIISVFKGNQNDVPELLLAGKYWQYNEELSELGNFYQILAKVVYNDKLYFINYSSSSDYCGVFVIENGTAEKISDLPSYISNLNPGSSDYDMTLSSVAIGNKWYIATSVIYLSYQKDYNNSSMSYKWGIYFKLLTYNFDNPGWSVKNIKLDSHSFMSVSTAWNYTYAEGEYQPYKPIVILFEFDSKPYYITTVSERYERVSKTYTSGNSTVHATDYLDNILDIGDLSDLTEDNFAYAAQRQVYKNNKYYYETYTAISLYAYSCTKKRSLSYTQGTNKWNSSLKKYVFTSHPKWMHSKPIVTDNRIYIPHYYVDFVNGQSVVSANIICLDGSSSNLDGIGISNNFESILNYSVIGGSSYSRFLNSVEDETRSKFLICGRHMYNIYIDEENNEVYVRESQSAIEPDSNVYCFKIDGKKNYNDLTPVVINGKICIFFENAAGDGIPGAGKIQNRLFYFD